MNKQKALDEAKQEYEKSLKQIETAQKVCDKVDSLLPKGWESSYCDEYLEFRNFALITPAIEFRVVCDIIEKATGEKLNRSASGSKRTPVITAHLYSNFGNSAWFTIWVESRPDDTCKLTFKRSWNLTPVADPTCLGIRKEKKEIRI